MTSSALRMKHLVMFASTSDSTCGCKLCILYSALLTYPGDGVDVAIWSMIELLLTVLVGSLPTLAPWTTQHNQKVHGNKTTTSRTATQEPDADERVGDDERKELDPPPMTIYHIPPRFSGTTKTASFTMSAISSFRSSDYWELPEPPLMIPTSKFQDSAVILPPPAYHKRWSQQPDSPTDPNVLAKHTSLYLTRTASEDLESNFSRDTWVLRDSYSQGTGERLSSRLARG